MKLQVKRAEPLDKCTIGALFINGVDAHIYTLEDVVRERPGVAVELWKLPGETAIPRGTYKIELRFSPHFQRVLPHLIDVDGFAWVLIHYGNSDTDTEGCILVGYSHPHGKDWIGESKKAFDDLYLKIEAAINRGEAVTIEVG